ncbi:MAG: NUDIX domain-containing protein [Candidatus Nanohaloarchaea archaeon]|nr:NUDIX domain-containing protein [Candidatus Nanohaloarchaea archaeon]
MARSPTPVVLAVVERDGDYLLVERDRGDFHGYWGFPGGKMEQDEHVGKAVERETAKETGLPAQFQGLRCTVSEFVKKRRSTKHVLIHVCDVTVRNEGELRGDADWFSEPELAELDTVPSLIPILDADAPYLESRIELHDDRYELTAFGPPD